MSIAASHMPPRNRSTSKASAGTASSRYLLSVLGISLASGTYFVLRYLGYWAETDSAVFAIMIEWMKEAGSIHYPGSYTHGYGYQVWASTLSLLTGVDVGVLLQIYTPLIGNLFLGLFGFVAFRRLLNSDRLGALAASFLFLVPELIFTVSRGNHEKLTVSLTLLALLCLLNSFSEMFSEGRWRVFAGWVVVFYLTLFTLASFNAFFGAGFITATTLTFIFAFIAVRLDALGRLRARKNHPKLSGISAASKDSSHLGRVARRLLLMIATGWLLVVLVTWYIYPSTEDNYALLEDARERFSVLFLGAAPEDESAAPVVSSDPYTLGNTDWSSLTAYRLVSAFRWLLFLSSFITWLVLVFRSLPNLSTVPLNRLFLLSFYGAFGFQLALAIPIDFLSLDAGTNLQVRMYTYFSLLAPPLFALGITSLLGRVRPGWFKQVLMGSVGVLFMGFLFSSLLKATLDPSISNRWLFYHPSEIQAIYFWNHRQEYTNMWLDPEGRLRYAYILAYQQHPVGGNNFNVGTPDVRSAHALYSPNIRMNAIAWQRAPSPYWFENLPYDNGEAQMYYRIPRTPFQN